MQFIGHCSFHASLNVFLGSKISSHHLTILLSGSIVILIVETEANEEAYVFQTVRKGLCASALSADFYHTLKDETTAVDDTQVHCGIAKTLISPRNCVVAIHDYSCTRFTCSGKQWSNVTNTGWLLPLAIICM